MGTRRPTHSRRAIKLAPLRKALPGAPAPHLQAASTAIQLLENETLTGQGNEALLFLPSPDETIDLGRPRHTTDPVPTQKKGIMELLDEAVEAARHDPKAAQQLFNLTTLGYREDEDRRQQICENFDKLGVPREFLSH